MQEALQESSCALFHSSHTIFTLECLIDIYITVINTWQLNTSIGKDVRFLDSDLCHQKCTDTNGSRIERGVTVCSITYHKKQLHLLSQCSSTLQDH